MNCAKTHSGLRILGTLALGGAALSIGCTGQGESADSYAVYTTSEPTALVFSSQPVREWHEARAGDPGVGVIPADRYEFTRNDARLTPATRGPILATRQWPEPPQPLERPVRFWRWQQR